MLYQKEIDDSVLIQFIIMFTLDSSDDKLLYTELINIVMDNCNINYTDFQLALSNLVDTGHVRSFMEGDRVQKFCITKKGKYAAEFFNSYIPIYIREPIEESIKELFLERRRQNAVRADIEPINLKGEYGATFQIYDDDKMQIMNLSLYTGSREQAESMVKFFKKNSSKVYENILKSFEEETSDGDE